MKVLMVQRFDLTNVGCAERIWRQAEVLARRGHEITLVQYPHPERRQTYPALRPDFPPGVRGIDLDRKSTALFRNARRIREQISRCDLVHLWKAYPDTGLPVLFGIRRIDRPLHYDWDDLEGGPGGIAENLTGSRLVGNLLETWEKEILRWADTVTVSSRELRNRCLACGFSEDRIFPGPVGAVVPRVDSDLQEKWKKRFSGKEVILFLGQMEAEDFPPAVLGAVRACCEEVPQLYLVLVGDGQARPNLEEEAKRLGFSDRILFTGYLPRKEAQAVLSLATVFLFPLQDHPMSRSKSPLVVIEAMAQGVPVIGSNVGEVPAMLEKEAGVLVPDLERDRWKEAILSVLKNRDERIRLSENAKRRFAESWTWDRAVDRLEAAYEKALDLHRSAGH